MIKGLSFFNLILDDKCGNNISRTMSDFRVILPRLFLSFEHVLIELVWRMMIWGSNRECLVMSLADDDEHVVGVPKHAMADRVSTPRGRQ